MTETAYFRAALEATETGGARIRIAPFGESVKSPYGDISFSRGSIRTEGLVPFTIDHGDSVLHRIGTVDAIVETDTAVYGSVTFANTQTAQDVRELMRAGAVTDVSVGIADWKVDDGVMSGVMDHVSAVDHGRFGKATNPSRVVAVNNDKEGTPPMSDDTATVEVATNQEPAVDDARFAALEDEIRTLRDEIDTTQNRVVDEPRLFRHLGDFIHTKLLAADGEAKAADKMAKFAMSADTTTTGAGAVPDYLISEMIENLRTQRAFTQSIRSISPGPYGMTVSMPAWGTEPTVTAQAAELNEPSSTTTSVTTNDVDLVTYTGANRISLQLVRRSSPDFVDAVIRHLLSAYNKVTDAAGILAVHTAATGAHTAIVADLSASASATFAAFNTANTTIIADMGRPADTVWLAPDKWAELNSLVDSDGRPLLVYGPNGPSNAQGQSSLSSMVAQYHGWTVRLVPDAAAATVLIGIANQAAYFADENELLRVTNVDSTSVDVGIMGLYAADALLGDAFYTITES